MSRASDEATERFFRVLLAVVFGCASYAAFTHAAPIPGAILAVLAVYMLWPEVVPLIAALLEALSD